MSISSTVMHRADIRFRQAADSLRPYVGCFWVVTAERNATIRVVPDGTASIFVERPEGQSAEWFLRGPLRRPQERRFRLPTILIGVRLRPGVAFLLSGIAGHTLLDGRIGLSSCAGIDALASVEPSGNAAQACIDALERFLIERLLNASVHQVVRTALREIDREHGCLRVEHIAACCRVSARHLNRLMRVWTGYSPKQYATIVRFQATLTRMDHPGRRSAAFLASEIGYFDQAHLTGETTRFAGATPGHLASRCVFHFSKTRCDDLP